MIKRPIITDTIVTSDQLFFWQTANGGYRASPMTVLIEFLNAELSTEAKKTTTTYSPAATGWTAVVENKNTWLLLTPTAVTAAGSITLPTGATDGIEVLVTSTMEVTALTITSADAQIIAAPATLAANDSFVLKYSGVTQTWYKVG